MCIRIKDVEVKINFICAIWYHSYKTAMIPLLILSWLNGHADGTLFQFLIGRIQRACLWPWNRFGNSNS